MTQRYHDVRCDKCDGQGEIKPKSFRYLGAEIGSTAKVQCPKCLGEGTVYIDLHKYARMRLIKAILVLAASYGGSFVFVILTMNNHDFKSFDLFFSLFLGYVLSIGLGIIFLREFIYHTVVVSYKVIRILNAQERTDK